MAGKKKKPDTDVAQKASKRARKDQTVSAPPPVSIAKNVSGKPPLLVFAHGAGAPSSSEWMIRWKKLLEASTDVTAVVTFDYPYFAGGKKRAPPKAEKLVGSHIEEIKKAQSQHPECPLVLVGKSMGSRISCMVAGQDELDISAVVCLGYPLKGMNGAIRDQTLLDLKVPVMFIQGSKDSLCPLNKLKEVITGMSCETNLHVIDGGDHSFKVGKKALQDQGITQEKIEEKAVDSICSFLKGVFGPQQT